MKKKIWILLGVVFCLAGCQESPEEDIVKNKNEGILEESMYEQAEKVEEMPDTYIDEFTDTAGEVRFVVEAEVNQADSSMPIVRVVPREIASDELQKWTEVLFEGNHAYEPVTGLSKMEIENEILWRRKKINDQTELMEEYEGDEVAVAEVVVYYEEQIASYESIYDTAADVIDVAESDWEFQAYEYYTDAAYFSDTSSEYEELNKTMKFYVQTNELNGHTATIDGTKRLEPDYQIHSLWFYYLDEHQMTDIPYKEMSVDEARAIADQARAGVELDDWQLFDYIVSENGSEHRYRFSYVPVYEGVTAVGGAEIDLKSDDLYAANLYYETLDIEVINGILRNVELNSPMEVLQVENDNVATLSFDEIYDLFKSQMQSEYTKDSFKGDNLDVEEDAELLQWIEDMDIEIRITSIQEGLFRIREKNSEEYLMVPVWAFYGTTAMGEEEEYTKELYSVINAVDGTTINTWLGY